MIFKYKTEILSKSKRVVYQKIKKISRGIFNRINFLKNLKYVKKYDTETGIYFLPRFAVSDIIRRDIIKDKIFDEEIVQEIKKWVRPESIFLDVGANYGQMSILAAKACPGLQVHAFEAQHYVFDLLKRNIKANTVDVVPYYALVGNKSGKIFVEPTDLNVHGTYGSNHMVETASHRGGAIEAMRVDDLIFTRPISLMKIDVQGMDLDVLKGSEATIKKYRMPVIFEFERYFMESHNYTFEDFVQFFNVVGYQMTEINSGNYLCAPL